MTSGSGSLELEALRSPQSVGVGIWETMAEGMGVNLGPKRAPLQRLGDLGRGMTE